MISSRLKNIFLLSIPVLIAHGLEEYFTGFYTIDPHANFVFGYINTLPTSQATFLLFQIMFWLILLLVAFLISSEKGRSYVMIIPGVIYLYELHHFWSALMVGGYYSGLITALAFPILAFFFWKEWLKNYKEQQI